MIDGGTGNASSVQTLDCVVPMGMLSYSLFSRPDQMYMSKVFSPSNLLALYPPPPFSHTYVVSAPQNVTVSSDDSCATATVTWEPPASSNTPILGYTITYRSYQVKHSIYNTYMWHCYVHVHASLAAASTSAYMPVIQCIGSVSYVYGMYTDWWNFASNQYYVWNFIHCHVSYHY